MPPIPPNPEHDTLEIGLPPASESLGPAIAPMFGLARRAQAAIADATLANIQEALSTAQQAVEATRDAIGEQSGQITERSALPATGPSAPQFPILQVPALQAPAIQAMAERNIKAIEEMTTLAQRRTQACMALPSHLAGCRTPHDILSLQMRFWNDTATDYAESSRRMMDAFVGQARTHVPTVAEVLGQRTGGPAAAERTPIERPAARETANGATMAAEVAKDSARRGPDGRRVA